MLWYKKKEHHYPILVRINGESSLYRKGPFFLREAFFKGQNRKIQKRPIEFSNYES